MQLVTYRSPAGMVDSPPPAPEVDSYEPLLRRLEQGIPISSDETTLVDEALAVWARPGFDTFVSIPRLRFEPFGYQLRAAERALRRMQGRAILADEVGLGKTIEAGLVASELRLRGLARDILVLVPAGLVEQWREELDRKFALPSVIVAGVRPEMGGRLGEEPIVIASLATARRAPLRNAIADRAWDLVVVDEAHRVRRPRSASSRLVRSLRAHYLLLLTATPVENRLDDLYQLVSLVRPGHLGTLAEFRARHGAASGNGAPRAIPELQSRTAEVMVRHRRSEVALALPRRLAQTLRVRPGPEETELYRLVSERVRRLGRNAPQAQALALRAVQRIAGSSPQALAPTLAKLGWDDLAASAAVVETTEKARVLFELLDRHRASGEKVVVFCAFRDTLAALARLALARGLGHSVYHGGLSRRAKEAAIGAFRDDAPILLTTEAAGEGRNLQFCHVMVNYDLPWNPMQIEQRLGRIHRIGQDHDVLVTNLVTKDTLEDRILRVLETKINLFELVVGELDMILGRVDDDFDFERVVFDAHVASRDDVELVQRLSSLGDELARARGAYLESRERTDRLVAEQAEC